ncbi:MAG TPA: hypothetical protein PLH91_13630 [Tenuifilaceae bacterium]|nr:hypothetical protein [Tenuifilaceae bacterium]HOZ14852.1 hypothetical protein [Tenuifilaceae bacterium]HPI46270.1 hypothetical protein [Tenuifilaceae bacterium]HPN23056.1 hypothetical protein [Tenuifilaceae bacterium]
MGEMDFINFLKYGAIGIALALAILSYRLLSKEQEKDTERPGFLRSIRNFMWLAIFLSVFFGLLEIVPLLLNNNKSDSSSFVANVWSNYFSQFNDSTAEQKERRISTYIEDSQRGTDTALICKQYIDKLEQYEAENDNGFYQNIIKLKKKLQASPDGWINLRFETSTKSETLLLLRNIFISLGSDCNGCTNEEIINNWETLKKGWADKQLNYVFSSDITELIKVYLRTYENK